MQVTATIASIDQEIAQLKPVRAIRSEQADDRDHKRSQFSLCHGDGPLAALDASSRF